MSQPSNKLSIQVKLKPLPPAHEPSQGRVAIHWGRLLGALGVIGGLIGAAFWFFSQPPSEAPSPAQKSQLEALPAMLTAPVAVTPPPESRLPPAEALVPADRDLALSEPISVESLPEPTEVAPEQQEVSEPMPAEATVRLLSEHVTHAQLSRGIEARQPTDIAPAVIDMGDETLIIVYLFTDLNQLRGTTLHYDWYLEGKRKARVAVRPRLDDMTVHSSKYIDAFMRGNWLVKVQTAAGELLAQGEFEVR